MTLHDFCRDHECTPDERRELRQYLAFLRLRMMFHWLFMGW